MGIVAEDVTEMSHFFFRVSRLNELRYKKINNTTWKSGKFSSRSLSFKKNRSSSLDAEIFLRIKNQKRYNSAAELGPRFLFPITYRRIFRYFGVVDMNSSKIVFFKLAYLKNGWTKFNL